MSCPNCGQIMQIVKKDEQNILHCPNCGGSFFEENGINRIILKTAAILAEDKRNDEISGEQKLCPKDRNDLEVLHNQESIPPDITLLSCTVCHGVFVYPDDLLNFKKAQIAKVNYFKSWSFPIPSIKTISVLSLLLIFALTTFLSYVVLQKSTYKIGAKDAIKNLYITRSNRYLFLSFKTAVSARSKVYFFDVTVNQTIQKIINSEPETTHLLTTSSLELDHEIYYQIILTFKDGKETKTELKKLEIK